MSSQGQKGTVDIADLKMTSLTRKILYEIDNKTPTVQLRDQNATKGKSVLLF